ncbi:hypothetical protein Tco_0583972 [Tanacetum coccineum]
MYRPVAGQNGLGISKKNENAYLKKNNDDGNKASSSKNKQVVFTSNAFSVLSEDTFIADDGITAGSVKESTWKCLYSSTFVVEGLPYRNSDHAPAVLKIQQVTKTKSKSFKFSNFVAYQPEFKQLVEEGWKHVVNGYNMFKVVKKLRYLKKSMRKLVMNQEEEALYLKAFNEAVLDEERYLKQKAKVEWLSVGDSNSSYFHKMVKSKVSRSRVEVVLDSSNIIHEALMCREVSNNEIKDAMFSIRNDKAPGLDGYSSFFFKKAWDIVGEDVCRAVQDFFVNGKLLQAINHTLLALIPKLEPIYHNTTSRLVHDFTTSRLLYNFTTSRLLHNLKTSSQLHNFTTSSQLQDFFTTLWLHFTTLLISQLSNTTVSGFGIGVGLLGDVIGEDDGDDDG